MKRLLIAVLSGLAITAALVLREPDAIGLANPLKAGRNVAVNATSTAQQIPVVGQDCAVTIQVDFSGGATTFPVCSGYDQRFDGGSRLTSSNCILPVCLDGTKCVGPYVVRDAAPGAIYFLAPDPHPDAGVPVRIEMSAGCKSP